MIEHEFCHLKMMDDSLYIYIKKMSIRKARNIKMEYSFASKIDSLKNKFLQKMKEDTFDIEEKIGVDISSKEGIHYFYKIRFDKQAKDASEKMQSSLYNYFGSASNKISSREKIIDNKKIIKIQIPADIFFKEETNSWSLLFWFSIMVITLIVFFYSIFNIFISFYQEK